MILRYGIYSSLFLIGCNLVMLALLGTDPSSFGIGEVLGYSAIALSMVFVFLGIREYIRQNEEARFWNTLKVGTLIALIPSIIFGIYNLIYVKWIDPNFNQNYLQYQIDSMQNPTTEEIDALKVSMEMWENPFLMMFVMFLTVLVIGFIVAIISSMAIRKKA